MMKRCFLGFKLGIPSRDIPEILQELDNKHRPKHEKKKVLRIVDPELYHFTIHFFGDISDDKIDSIIEALGSVKMEPFPIVVGGAGSLPPKKFSKTRVLYLRLEQGEQLLVNLVKKIHHKLSKMRFEIDKRRYTPHLTVARVSRGAKPYELAKEWNSLDLKEIIRSEIDSFQLYESTLTPEGPVYEVIHNFQLG